MDTIREVRRLNVDNLKVLYDQDLKKWHEYEYLIDIACQHSEITIDIIEWLYNHGQYFTKQSFYEIIKQDKVEIFTWLLEHYPIETQEEIYELLYEIARYGRLYMLKKVLTLKMFCPMEYELSLVCFYAIIYGNLSILSVLQEKKYVFLYEHQIYYILYNICKKDYFPILKWVNEHYHDFLVYLPEEDKTELLQRRMTKKMYDYLLIVFYGTLSI